MAFMYQRPKLTWLQWLNTYWFDCIMATAIIATIAGTLFVVWTDQREARVEKFHQVCRDSGGEPLYNGREWICFKKEVK